MPEPLKLDTVFLIDDDETVNFLNTVIIKSTGLIKNITAVSSAENALQELALRRNGNSWPGILFVEINMPKINGWEFLDQFRIQFKEYKNKCLVCMLSSSLDPRDQLMVNNSDIADFFIPKPLTVEAVSDLYHKYMELTS